MNMQYMVHRYTAERKKRRGEGGRKEGQDGGERKGGGYMCMYHVPMSSPAVCGVECKSADTQHQSQHGSGAQLLQFKLNSLSVSRN